MVVDLREPASSPSCNFAVLLFGRLQQPFRLCGGGLTNEAKRFWLCAVSSVLGKPVENHQVKLFFLMLWYYLPFFFIVLKKISLQNQQIYVVISRVIPN